MADNEQTPPPSASPPPRKSAEDVQKQAQAGTAAPGGKSRSLSATERRTRLNANNKSNPLNYAWGFTKGTVVGGLNGIATGGRIGLWTGVAAGIVGTIGFGLGAAPMMFLGVGAATVLLGIQLGGAIGAITGAYKGVQREKRRDKYSDELARKQQMKRPARRKGLGYAFDKYEEDVEERSEINFDRLFQQQREDQRDFGTSYSNNAGSNGSWVEREEQRNDVNFDRQFQQQQEDRRDSGIIYGNRSDSWADREEQRRSQSHNEDPSRGY